MAERPEDLNLPNSVVARIIKEALPDGVNVSKEARTAITKAASVFVLYATSCANNLATKANRKTINGQDVLAAMADMEFEKFLEPLEMSLEAHKKSQKEKKEAMAKKKQEEAKEDNKEATDDEAAENDNENEKENEEEAASD